MWVDITAPVGVFRLRCYLAPGQDLMWVGCPHPADRGVRDLPLAGWGHPACILSL